MRTALLIFGIIYIGLGLMFLNTVGRMLSLYEQFNAQLPLLTYFAIAFVIALPIYGLAQIIIYLKKIKNEKLFSLLMLVNILILLFGIGFLVMSLVLPIYNLTTTL
jgi:hypothetical protein